MAKANPDSVFSLGGRLVNRMNSLGVSQERIDEITKTDDTFWTRFDGLVMNVDPGIAGDAETRGKEVFDRLIAPQLKAWDEFYLKYFDIVVLLPPDWQSIIPAHKQGFDRLIVVARGLSINQVYERGRQNFSSWKWCDGDIESVMRQSERGEAKEIYAIWVEDSCEVPQTLLGRSAKSIKKPADTENLLERLLHGFKYWNETGEHLDEKTATLCASSRYAGGGVPGTYLSHGGGVHVLGYDPRGRIASIGARRVVR